MFIIQMQNVNRDYLGTHLTDMLVNSLSVLTNSALLLKIKRYAPILRILIPIELPSR